MAARPDPAFSPFRRPDAAPLDRPDNGHPRRQLSFLRLNAEDPGVGDVKSIENARGRGQHRPGREGFDENAVRVRTGVGERLLEACRHFPARFVGDEGDPLTAPDRETGLYRVARAREKIGSRGTKHHPSEVYQQGRRWHGGQTGMSRG